MESLKYRRLPLKLDRIHKVLSYLGNTDQDGQMQFPINGLGALSFRVRVRQIPVDVSFDGERVVHAEVFHPMLGRQICAKSKCHGEDVFDLALGIRLAIARVFDRLFTVLEESQLESLRRTEALRQEVLEAVDPCASYWIDADKAERDPEELMAETKLMEVLGIA